MAISGANEVYKNISPLVEQQFPEYIRENGPRFVAFMEAYYEYLEQSGKSIDAIRTLKDNQDIDRTVTEFVEYFRKQYALSIPKTALADKRLIVKHIREFYRSRGSQKSFKFLFHILFGADVNFYYPGEDVLRASDGRWIRETVLTVEKRTGILTDLDGRVVTGQTSGAIGRVQGILTTINLGIEVFTLTVENTSGTFLDKEIVSDGFGNTVTVRAGIGGLISQTITNGGAFNVKGDSLSLSGTISGSVAEGLVSSIENTPGSLTFRISKGGTGYRTGVNSRFTFGVISSTVPVVTPILEVVSLSNTSTITMFSDTIGPVRNVVLNGNLPTSNVGLSFGSLGTNSAILSSNIAVANVYSRLNKALKVGPVTVGSINAISIISPGFGYDTFPTVTVVDQDIVYQSNTAIRGNDAVIAVDRAPGTITGITITSAGTDFILGEKVNITNSRSGNSVSNLANTTTTDTSTPPGIKRHVLNRVYNGNTFVTSVSGIRTLTGRYLGTKGFLSWNNKIQDSDYYQEFSYAIKSSVLVDKYRDVVQNLLHPAGTKMFGTYEVTSVPNMQVTVASSVPQSIFQDNFLPYMLEDNTGYLRIENPVARFLLEDNSGDALIAENPDNLIEEQFDTNFVSYMERERSDEIFYKPLIEVIVPTDILTGGVITSASVFETAGTVADASSAKVTKEVNIYETSGTPVDLETAVYSGTPSVIEDSTPVDLQTAVYTGPAAILETSGTPVDLETAVYTGPAAILETSGTPVDIETAVYSGTPTVIEDSTPVDLETAVYTGPAAILETSGTPVDLQTAVYSGTPAVIETSTPVDLETAVYTGPAEILETSTPVDLETAVYTGPAEILEVSTPVDLQTAVYTGPAAILETSGTASDSVFPFITKEVSVYEDSGTPVDLETAVYSGTPAVIEVSTPVDLEPAGVNTSALILETSGTPVDLEPAGVNTSALILETSGTPVDLETAVYTGPAAILETSGTPVDLQTAVVFNLSTTTGQSTGFVRVVYGNTQISTFSKDTVNVFKAVQLQTVTDLDGIPRLVLVTSPDIGRNLDRQANGNFGNGSIVSTTTVRIIPEYATFASNTNLFTVSTVHSNSFLTLTSDYIPTTANARMYWVS
jgi:hypothetical protein